MFKPFLAFKAMISLLENVKWKFAKIKLVKIESVKLCGNRDHFHLIILQYTKQAMKTSRIIELNDGIYLSA